MARKQITSLSSPTEMRIANEQLVQAQQEFNELYKQYSNKSISATQLTKLAQSVASKYDYVDFGQPIITGVNEINIGGDKFFVNGLGNQTQTTFAPEARTTQSFDDAYPAMRPAIPASRSNTTPGVNPNVDQNIYYQYAPTQTTTGLEAAQTTSTGAKDVNEIGSAIDRQRKEQAYTRQTGIVEDIRNYTPTTNLPASVNDSQPKFSKSMEDAAKPMGTEMSGFGNDITTTDIARKSNGTVVSGTKEGMPTSSQSSKGTPNKAGIEVKPNVLHNYVNWTYKLAWYMMPIDSYNSMMRSGKVASDASTLIARSGGVGGELDGAMAGDVYFRSLRFTSVIGNRQASAATNNIEIEMTIVEPYGASLIGELAGMALNMTKKSSVSPAEVPYLLEIDFAGYKDDGTIVPSILGSAQGGKKFIPVKILFVEMRLEAAGAVYTFTMAPYSYFAQTARYAEMEYGLKLEGKTVIELLGGEGKGLIAQLNAREQWKKDEGIIKEKDEYYIDLFSFSPNGSRDQAMSQSPLAYPKGENNSTVVKLRPADNNVLTGTYIVGQGNIIKDVIKNVVLTSQYYNEKMTPEKTNDTSKPAELIKIIPVIEVMKDKYDTARNEFAKRITYKVFNTLLFGEVHPYVGNAPVSQWGYSKEYQWLFTGKNADVIEADLSFSYIYFAKMQTNVTDHNTIQLQEPNPNKRSPADQSSASMKGIALRAGAVSNSGGNMPQRYINATLAAEWFDSKMMSNTGDNVSINIRIIGDPDWIPQDSSIRGGGISIGNDLYDSHGSIAVDVAGVYIRLVLQTPRDYNPTTGLMDIKKDTKSTLEGIYQVITVENSFEDGRFTQTLSLVKVPNQEDEKPKNSSGGIFTSNNPADRELIQPNVNRAGQGGGRNANPTQPFGPR